MSADVTDFKKYNPAAWHKDGLVQATIEEAEIPRQARRTRRSAIIATFVLATSALFVANGEIPLLIDPSSAASSYMTLRASPSGSEQSPDEVDPSVWGRMIAYLDTLPTVDIVEPDDVPPFI